MGISVALTLKVEDVTSVQHMSCRTPTMTLQLLAFFKLKPVTTCLCLLPCTMSVSVLHRW